jgi:hypothetical protein
MMNWENGNPNARYWVLRLIKENFGAGDILVTTTCKSKGNFVVAQGIKTKQGKKILLINKNKAEATVVLPTEVNSIKQVDVSTRESAPSVVAVNGNTVTLKAFGVAVVEVR